MTSSSTKLADSTRRRQSLVCCTGLTPKSVQLLPQAVRVWPVHVHLACLPRDWHVSCKLQDAKPPWTPVASSI